MANYTPQQAKAIETQDKNLVVVAGAGSGKTHVLVERYVTLLESHPDWPLNALVAITFTREAALEMRNRVRQRLEAGLTTAATDDSRKRWSQLLSEMDSARIDTIHGLCATILRANAAQAGVDPQFEVLEPVEATALLTAAIDTVLHELSENDTDTAALFTEYDIWQVREVLSQADLLTARLNEIPQDAETLFEQWRQEWEQTYRDAMTRLLADSTMQAALNWQTGQHVPPDDSLTSNFHLLDTHHDKLASEDVQVSQQAARTLVDEISLRGGSSKKWSSKELVNEAKDALRTIREALKDLLERIGEPPGEIDRRGADMLVRWYRLFGRVRDAYETAKADAAALDFNDLEHITADLLTSHDDVSRRYRGAEFRRLLVDEFQDTNEAQWQIVQALADFDSGALFVVGDMKQSIYGFRGADVRVFGSVRETIQAHDAGEELPLARSFRSHPALIDVFNALFADLLTRDENSPVSAFQIAFDTQIDTMDAHRDPLPQTAADTFSPVEFLLLQTKSPDLDENIKADERRLWEAYAIADRLKRLKDEKTEIFDKDSGKYRDFDFGDVAILFRSTTNLPIYENVFKVADLPFVTVGGRGYYNRQEVWDVLNLLKALHNPSDNLSLAAALRSPMFGFDDDMLLTLRGLKDDNGRQSLWVALAAETLPGLSAEEVERVRSARRMLRNLRQLAGRVTISELLRQSLAETGYLAALTGLPGGARLRRNVEKLIEIAEDSGKITLGAFSHYLDDLTAREVREGEAALDAGGAVRLMTVHASKGLEFPVVVLADASRRPYGGSYDPVLYDDRYQRLVCRVYDDDEGKLVDTFPYTQAKYIQSLKDEAEELRLLYVAATRARDCLILSGEIRRNRSGWTSYGWLDQVVSTIDEDIYSAFDEADSGFLLDYAGTKLRVHLPHYDPKLTQRVQGSDVRSEWRELDVIDDDVPAPPNLEPLPIHENDMLGHITATQLALIGGFQHDPDDERRASYQQYLRRQAFDDAPGRIRDVQSSSETPIKRRDVGEVVHEMLRYWRFPSSENDYDDLLRSYAWQQGITNPAYIERVIRRAHTLLEQFQQSDLYADINAIRQANGVFYAEMPFLFRTDKRILHGIMDALYQRPDKTWIVLDYKTSYVPVDESGTRDIDAHARRYYLQVGAYAAAVQQQLNVTPIVYIHYIPYNKTVEVPAASWQAEIRRIEATIGTVLHAETLSD